MANVHNTAILTGDIELGDGVEVGPYCVLSGRIKIGNNTVLKSHVCVADNTIIGEGNIIYPFTSLGEVPQDKKFNNGETELIIGNNNQIREHVTINKGTEAGGGKTIIGSNNLIMSMTHIAHDCILGNKIVMSNGAMIAGHVVVEDNVIIGGMSGVHQFCKIGKGAMIGGMSAVRGHVIPFSLTKGDCVIGTNIIGLKRMQYEKSDIRAIMEVINTLSRKQSSMQTMVADFMKSENKFVQYIADFIKNSNSAVGLVHFDIS